MGERWALSVGVLLRVLRRPLLMLRLWRRRLWRWRQRRRRRPPPLMSCCLEVAAADGGRGVEDDDLGGKANGLPS